MANVRYRFQEPAISGCTLWFVDDNEFALGALKAIFTTQSRKLNISTFYSADALLEHLQQTAEQSSVELIAQKKNEPDIIFLDQSMPGTGGLDAISSILHYAPSVKIIMLTHFDFPRFVERAFQQGAYGYILKSSDPQQFWDAMHAVIQGKKYIDPTLKDDVFKVTGLKIESH